ncbi:MAG: GIY-YIG nuclease family protein [Bacteroidetes bacterium]|jgi:putative endonuclease|nr:GIY-YIG nuclease family protein [Bacteroidota bacterium]
MEKYFVYILYSETLNVYYKGFTENIEKRLEYHLTGLYKYTSQTRDWKLVYTNTFHTKKEALIEEKRLKKLNRVSIEKLIKG